MDVPPRIKPTRFSIDSLKTFMEDIASTIPTDAQEDSVPQEQKWIVTTNLHVAAHKHVQNSSSSSSKEYYLNFLTGTARTYKR